MPTGCNKCVWEVGVVAACGDCVFKTSLPCCHSFFSYITINHQPYIAFHFFARMFFCRYYCSFLSTKLFLHNYNVMIGSEM